MLLVSAGGQARQGQGVEGSESSRHVSGGWDGERAVAMKVSTRLAFSLVALMAFFVGVMSLLRAAQFYGMELVLENRKQEAARFSRQIIELEGEGLRNMVTDFSLWDEMCGFVQSGDPLWGRENIDTAFANFGVQSVWVFDAQWAPVYSSSTLALPPEMPFPAMEADREQFKSKHLTRYFLPVPGGFMELRGETIHPSADLNRTTPPRGYLFLGRLWDDAQLAKLGRLLGGTVSFSVDAGASVPEPVAAGDMVAQYVSLPAWNGDVGANLKIVSKVPLISRFSIETNRILFTGALLAVLVVLASWLLLYRWVARPLSLLSAGLDGLDAKPLRQLEDSSSEFGHIAKAIIAYFGQTEKLTREIEARRAAEEALLESESRFSRIVYTANEGIWVMDENRATTFVNDKMAGMLGCAPGEIMGRAMDDFTEEGEDGPQAGTERVESVRERRFRKKDGSALWAIVSATPMIDEQGGFLGSFAMLTDITERKEAEEALRESEAAVRRKLRVLTEPEGDIAGLELADVIDAAAIQSLMEDLHRVTRLQASIVDMSGKVLASIGWQDICTQFHRANTGTCANCVDSNTGLLRGVPCGEFNIERCKNGLWVIGTPIVVGGNTLGGMLLGQFLFEGELPDYAFFTRQAREHGFDEEEYLSALGRVPRLTRERVDAIMVFYAKFADMIASMSYSTIKLSRLLAEQQRLMDELRASEEKQRLLADNASDVIWLMDREARFTYISPSVEKLRGYTAEEAMRQTLDESLTPESAARVTELFAQALDDLVRNGRFEPYRGEFEQPHKNGGTVWAEVSINGMFDASGQFVGILGVSRDVTERRRTGEALRESEERFFNAFEHAAIGMALVSLEGRFMKVNSSLCAMLGYSAGEMLELTFQEITHPEDLWESRERHRRLIAGESGAFKLQKRYYHKSGAVVWTLISVSLVRDRGGAPLYEIVQLEDITERRNAEEAMARQLQELRRWYEVTLGREGRMVELKREINTLALRLGEAPPYDLSPEAGMAGKGKA